MRVDPAVQNGTVTVDVKLTGELPKGARPDLSVDGTVDLERLDNVLYVGRPAFGQENSTISLFKLDGDGHDAIRVPVKVGRASVNSIQVVEGLHEGDTVVLTSEKVAMPVAVRYAWSDKHPWANLFNKDGLPALPFRTDEW